MKRYSNANRQSTVYKRLLTFLVETEHADTNGITASVKRV